MTTVYVIAAEGGPVKVGMANDPEKRMEALRTGAPFRLCLAHVEDVAGLDARSVEAAAHARLAGARAHGEWFAVTVDQARDAVRDAVRRHREGQDSEPRPAPIIIRAARALLDISQPELAVAAGVGLSTIVDFERRRRRLPEATLGTIVRALEAAGVVFIDQNGGGPGVRLRDPLL